MIRNTEAIRGGNPSKNQTFSGVSETVQSIWDKDLVSFSPLERASRQDKSQQGNEA